MGTTETKAGSPSNGRPRRTSSGASLADALFTATQQRLLGLLFGQPDRRFSLSELIRLARSGTGAVQREVARLGHAGIVTITAADGRKYVQANPATPIFEELRGIVEKTSGVAARLREALDPEAGRIPLALLYGSVAKGTDVSSSDIDLLLVSNELTQEDAFRLFEDAETRLGRRVNPSLYTREEFTRRRRARSPFLDKVLAGEHVVLLGSVDDLAS